MLSPHNVRLPFWLFNFEESVDAFLGGRAASDEELEILAEIIPLAKAAYLQYRANDRQTVKRRDGKNGGFTADTPVPYRIEDLLVLLDERMGKLENRSIARGLSQAHIAHSNPAESPALLVHVRERQSRR